ncbi:MAG: HNH endonuclease [Candidatus Cyclobacteriaceae bacterium M3_2C_046]
MQKHVLVLNQDYSPLTVCTVQRAFLLVFLQKAELLTENFNHTLRTISRSYPMPAVIRLNRYIKLPYRGVVLTRNNVFKRDNFECQYCGTNKDLTLDHLIPKARGGRSSWNNLVTACRRCNTRKGNYTLEEIGMEIKRNPFKPSYIMFIRDFSGYVQEEWMPYLNYV